MRVLLIGSGGREHALAWSLSRSRFLTELHAAPGNPGIAALATCHPVAGEDCRGLLRLARSLASDLVVVGPEVPLVAGLADTLRGAGFRVFGPGADAALIEGSKSFAKDVMAAAGVPTACRLATAKAPCVVKADGLASGKGVAVCRNESELREGLEAVARYGGDVVVEELLTGPEVSLFALTDGRDVLVLPAAQDYKRAFDGDEGPNTGGMGSYAPATVDGMPSVEELADLTVRPVLAELGRRGRPFVGMLFVGVMLTADGPRVLEYNCRFGDPETQSLVPLVEGDLLGALAAAAAGELRGVPLPLDQGAAVTVVLASATYPARGERGSPISGIANAEDEGALVFHAGTALEHGRLVTNGGRVLNVTAAGSSVGEARDRVYSAAQQIAWEGMRYRTDIAALAAGVGPTRAGARGVRSL